MTADWDALQGAIDGVVVLPGSPDYESVRKPAMARFAQLRPAAVVRCATPADVAATLAMARGLGLPTAIRSGGHSVAGRSSTEGVVLDVTPMRSVAVAGGVTTVGAGVRLGELYDALATHGLTIPAGCGPTVGIAGLTLGGGLGILGRRHGLTCDHLLAGQVVLADGRVVDCDEHHDQALFWGLRGAGGGHFGVVTSLVFRTLPAPAVTVFQLTWPPAAAAAVVQAWQAVAPEGPDELDATLRLTAGDGERPPGVEVVGTVLDGQADATELLGELVDRVGTDPVQASRRHLPHRAAKRYLTQGLAPGQSREVDFLPWGGAYNRVPADATAFVHRGERSGRARRRPRLAGALVGAGASIGIWGRVPELPRPRPPGLARAYPGGTTTACDGSRRRTTRAASSASTSHFPSG